MSNSISFTSPNKCVCGGLVYNSIAGEGGFFGLNDAVIVLQLGREKHEKKHGVTVLEQHFHSHRAW